ncbi:hypothetical protein MN116_009058 [Schistosoma mekongi]|uniref:Uncharacterized protein n=1 Tax=Schistosoma mekongi TaxID=38744 RepID=A0AAE1Z5F8_SCHME|nr:hypothetical protein MN116_009058 [Schistosoma mekongi]
MVSYSQNATLIITPIEKSSEEISVLISIFFGRLTGLMINTDVSNTPILNLNSPDHPCNESSQLNNSPPPNPKNSGLRLRLCRQGSQLIVIPPSDPYNSSQVLNTSSKELALINDCNDNSWFSWANQLLSDGERIFHFLLYSNTDVSNTPILNLNSPDHPCNESSQLNNSPPPNPKNSGLRLRLCRQGSQLIVIPPSDPYNSSQVLNTSSKELALINDCNDNSWFSWANQLLSDGERIVSIKISSDESVILSPRFRSHASSDLKELVRELLAPVINNLNNGSISSKMQFVHCLLSVLAHAAMTRVSNTIRNRIAIELYRHWSQQLQVNVSEPNSSSTPYCYNSKSPPFMSMETDNLLNTCIDPPTLILASSSFNSSSSETSVDTTVS